MTLRRCTRATETFRGVTVALARDDAGTPDRRRFYLLRPAGDAWDLVDMDAAAASSGALLPIELRDAHWSQAWRSWLFAVAAYLARIGRTHATHPTTPVAKAEPEDARKWWTE